MKTLVSVVALIWGSIVIVGCGDTARDSLELEAQFFFADGTSPIANLNIVKYDLQFRFKTGNVETYTIMPSRAQTGSSGSWSTRISDMNLRASSTTEICRQTCVTPLFNGCGRYVISCENVRMTFNIYDIQSATAAAYYRVGDVVIETPLQPIGFVAATIQDGGTDSGTDSGVDASSQRPLEAYPDSAGYANARLWRQRDVFIVPFQNWDALMAAAASSAETPGSSTSPLSSFRSSNSHPNGPVIQSFQQFQQRFPIRR